MSYMNGKRCLEAEHNQSGEQCKNIASYEDDYCGVHRDRRRIAALEAQLAKAEKKLRHREAYLETVIEAFMIQYCPDGEGVSEASMGEAYAARGVTCSDELYASVDAAREASEKDESP